MLMHAAVRAADGTTVASFLKQTSCYKIREAVQNITTSQRLLRPNKLQAEQLIVTNACRSAHSGCAPKLIVCRLEPVCRGPNAHLI